jgi:hypothetical protein
MDRYDRHGILTERTYDFYVHFNCDLKRVVRKFFYSPKGRIMKFARRYAQELENDFVRQNRVKIDPSHIVSVEMRIHGVESPWYKPCVVTYNDNERRLIMIDDVSDGEMF